MAKLVLEILHRGNCAYHKLDSLPKTLGRALDNDIIVSDVTVSPYHLKLLESPDGGVILQNLSAENGTRLAKKSLGNEPVEVQLPVELQMGDLSAKLMAESSEVAPTQLVSGSSRVLSFLSSPAWSLALVVLTSLSILFGRHVSTPIAEEPLKYLSDVLPALLLVFGLALLIAGISRLSMHRWAFIPALSIASLFFLVPQLFEHIGHFLDYLFTSSTPSIVLEQISRFLLRPALLMIYMIRVHYTKYLPALGIAVLVTMPVSAFYVSDLVEQVSAGTSFSPMPRYNKTLSAMDIRLQKSTDVRSFVESAQENLAKQIGDKLEKAKEK